MSVRYTGAACNSSVCRERSALTLRPLRPFPACKAESAASPLKSLGPLQTSNNIHNSASKFLEGANA
jgi:hypothetical protein